MKSYYYLLALVMFFGCKNESESKAASEALPEQNIETTTTESNKEVHSTAQAIAYKYGYENWDAVNEVKFTFNVTRGERGFARSWIWEPKTGDVTMMRDGDTISYNHYKVDSLSMKADKGFINDRYWLLAPFNLMWDEGTSFSETKNVIAPISKDTLNKLTVVYGDQGGYTPGDAYEFFYDSEFMIKEWAFRRGNEERYNLINTWEDHETFNGIVISKLHMDSTETGFRTFFTDIEINK